MKIKWNKVNRQTHHWGSFICAIPIFIVIVTGILLQLKKEFVWVQPPTKKGSSKVPTITFDQVLNTAKTVKEAAINDWKDIDRLDVRPDKGVIKIRAKNRWEIQIDHQTGKLLQTAYRRSDFIESIHDGSFFHDKAKLGVFLPSALVLLALWITGIYLFATTTMRVKNKKKKPKMKNLKRTTNITNEVGV
jgi:uncharacterized iron-regulated membrane protein